MRRSTQPSRRQGFTFIEIMVVTIIIGLMAVFAAVAYAQHLIKAQRRIAHTAIIHLDSTVEIYYADNGLYPTTQQGLQALLTKPTSPPIPRGWTSPYLKRGDILIDPWGRPYQYKCPGEDNRDFDIWSKAKSELDPEDDIGNW